MFMLFCHITNNFIFDNNTRQLQCVDVNSPLEIVFKHVYTVYAYSIVNKSIIILLENNLANICSKISKIQ